MKEDVLTMADLEGRTCSQAEMAALQAWARREVARSAQVLQAVAFPRGFLLQVIARGLPAPQWHGIGRRELTQVAQDPTL